MMEEVLKDLKETQDSVKFTSLISTERSINLLQHSEDVASKTSHTLVEQREKLERTSANLDHINESLKSSQKNINKMKGVFTRIKSIFPKRTRNGNSPSQMPLRVPQTINEEESREACQSLGESSGTEHHSVAPERGDEVEDKINDNMRIMSDKLTNLMTMALHMGDEIDAQNGILDDIRNKADMADATIAAQDLQIKKLLR